MSERGKAYKQVMTLPEFDNFLLEMKNNGQHAIFLDFLSLLSGEAALTEPVREQLIE